MNGFLYRIAEFMRGRRGWDQFGFFLMIASFIIEIAGNILRMRLVYYIGLALFFYCIFRIFSKNLYKREQENVKFMQIVYRFRNRRDIRQQKKDSTVYAYYYCPSCKQQVRIPAGKGRVSVTCPRCGEKFDANS